MSGHPKSLARWLGRWVIAMLAIPLPTASAFPHVVKPGETLAQIATRVYGSAKKETVLVGANALDAQGGSAIVPGMRLEVPAPGHHRIERGETWAGVALNWLGDAKRADTLARANHAVSWVQPVEALEIEIPPVIAHIAADGDSSTLVALRYWGDGNRSWELNMYNGRKEAPMHRGEIILMPLFDLALTEAGKEEARASFEQTRTEGEGAALEVQRHAEAEALALVGDVSKGRYVEAVARGNRLLGAGELTHPQLAVLHRALLEAYVALDAYGLATQACGAWHSNDPAAKLDPTTASPKIRAACAR